MFSSRGKSFKMKVFKKGTEDQKYEQKFSYHKVSLSSLALKLLIKSPFKTHDFEFPIQGFKIEFKKLVNTALVQVTCFPACMRKVIMRSRWTIDGMYVSAS